jgi:endoglucanase
VVGYDADAEHAVTKGTIRILATALGTLVLPLLAAPRLRGDEIALNDRDYFEARGLSVLLYHNAVHGVFFDQKLSGLEIILHGERIATNGDVRLLPTPEQWDTVARFEKRVRESSPDRLTAFCEFPDQHLSYRLEVRAEGEGLRVAVHLDQPLPEALAGKAGFNLEFLPTAYFGKSFLMDDAFGVFPRHPDGPMEREPDGTAEPRPLAVGKSVVLSPEDPLTRVTIVSETGNLMLFDGRNKAQNGWFVVRSLVPPGRTEDAVVWHVRPNRVDGWVRPPVVAHNQVGYTPDQPKVAILELDPLFDAPRAARVLRVTAGGELLEAFRGEIAPWGRWLRYQYARFDFSPVRDPGVYLIEYAGHMTAPFRVASDVYRRGVWQPALDTFLPVQMDHVLVREGYRVWHGPSHLDDARQAPPNHEHFDGYSMPSYTDSPYEAGAHVPGLDRGGWYDAGDFDLRTQTQAEVIENLVLLKERFGVAEDETTVDEKARYVEIRRPDGVDDLVQQVEHGVLALLAQYHAFGHAIPGIIAPTLRQYTHLGDAASKTDNRVYAPDLGPLETDGLRSGVPDDRWAFTTRTTPLQYGTAAALAAASRVLREHDADLARECLQTAARAWDEEQGRPPTEFRSFNTTGGDPTAEEVRAAVELLLATNGGAAYRDRLKERLPVIVDRFGWLGGTAVRAIPFMDTEFKAALAAAARSSKATLDARLRENPFGVPFATGTWGGAGGVAAFATQMYLLHEAFPDVIGPEYTLRAVDYVLGTHPVSSTSYVSSVGSRSTLVAYGSNRADYTFIPGGMIPGVVLVKPDFPELKEAWPFLWFEKEYVVSTAPAFALAVNAADALTREAASPSSGPAR